MLRRTWYPLLRPGRSFLHPRSWSKKKGDKSSLFLPRKEADDITDWFAAYNARNFLSWWQPPADLNPAGQSDRKRLQAALWSYLSTFADGADSDKKDIELPLKMRLLFQNMKINSYEMKGHLLLIWYTHHLKVAPVISLQPFQLWMEEKVKWICKDFSSKENPSCII